MEEASHARSAYSEEFFYKPLSTYMYVVEGGRRGGEGERKGRGVGVLTVRSP